MITTFESVNRAYISDENQVLKLSWADSVELLLDHHPITFKEQGSLFNLAEFKQIGDPTAELGQEKIFVNREWTGKYRYFPNTVRRCSANVVKVFGLMLDYDKNISIEKAIESLYGIEFVLYTTFNHTKDAHRFRVALPFSVPATLEELNQRGQSIKTTFAGVDDASFSNSQSFYFHAGLNDPIAHHNTGYILNPLTDFVEGPPIIKQIPKEYTSDFEISDDYKQRILSSLHTCRGVRYPKGLTLVALCKSIGLSFSEFDLLCKAIADSDSTLIKVPGSRVDLWNSDCDRITKDKREKFIREHNGSIGYGKLTNRKILQRD